MKKTKLNANLIKKYHQELVYNYSGVEEIKNIVPRISSTFLRQNLDLLN